MKRLSRAALASLLLSVPLLAQTPEGVDKPAVPAGNWKVLLPTFENGGSQPVWLIQIESTGGTWGGKVLASGQGWPKAEVEKMTVGAETLRLTLKATDLSLRCEIRLVKGAEKLRGESRFRGESVPVELERTALTSLNPVGLAREELAKMTPGVNSILLAEKLLSVAESQKASLTDARSWAEKAVKTAELYGAGYQRETILTVAELLVRQKGYEAVALPYAQRAERLLEGKEPPAEQKRVLDVLAMALEKTGKEEDAKAVQARLKKLDFRVKSKTYAGRKGKSDRVVLLELFTNAGFKPSVASDQAALALTRTFKPSELVVLNYHLSQPEPDPLACPDTEGRFFDYYKLERLPTGELDGKPARVPSGGDSEAQAAYDEFVEVIERELEKPAQATLTLEAANKGGKITIKAEASKLTRATDENVKLRVAVVEDLVSYKGGNSLVTHANVVRAVPEARGAAFKDKVAQLNATVDLAELRKKHLEFLEKAAKERPFPTKDQPIELKKLRVVAYVQDDESNEILQAAVVEVKGE